MIEYVIGFTAVSVYVWIGVGAIAALLIYIIAPTEYDDYYTSTYMLLGGYLIFILCVNFIKYGKHRCKRIIKILKK